MSKNFDVNFVIILHHEKIIILDIYHLKNLRVEKGGLENQKLLVAQWRKELKK